MKGLFNINWTNVKSAVVYGLLTMAVVFILSVIQDILKNQSIFGLDWNAIINHGVIATLGIMVTFVSIAKNFLTDDKGQFLGATTVIPDKTVQGE